MPSYTLQLLPATTYKATRNQPKRSRDGSTGFPDGATHLDIELSCYEDHPSSLSFEGNQTVAQVQAHILRMQKRLRDSLIESWLEQTSPESGIEGTFQEAELRLDKQSEKQLSPSKPAQSSKRYRDKSALRPRAGGIRRRYGGRRQTRLSPILSVSCESSPRSGVPRRLSARTLSGPSPDFDASNALLLHFGDKHAKESSSFENSPKSSTRNRSKNAIRGTMPSRQPPSQMIPNQNHNFDVEMFLEPNASTRNHSHNRVWLWSETISVFLAFFNTCGMAMAWGGFHAYYSNTLLYNDASAKIALIGSIQSFLLLAMAMPIFAATRMGCQRVSLGVGSILYVIAMVCASFCQNWVSLFLTQGIVLGIALGMVLHARISKVGKGLEARKRLIMTTCVTGSCTGGIVYILMFQQLIEVIGLGWTMRCMALVAAVTLVPTNLLLRFQDTSNGPEQLFMGRGSTDASACIHLNGIFSSLWGLGAAFVYLPLFAIRNLQSSFKDACSLLVTLYAACLFSHIIFTLVVNHHLSLRATSVASCLLGGAAMFWWIAVDSRSAAYALSALLGVFCAGITLVLCAWNQEDRIQRSCYTNRSLGSKWLLLGVALLTGGPICGALVDASDGSFLYMQIFAGCTLVLGSIIIATSGWLKQG